MDDNFDFFDQKQTVASANSQDLPIVVDVEQQEQTDKRKSVRHSVVFPQTMQPPEDMEDPVYQLPKVQKMARQFAFELDPFQQKAVSALERGDSVLVSAHTSAGKTVVAEYAIAQCLQRKQRIIYTSPIKALSNQKYRDLTIQYQNDEQFPNIQIGLMTGDTTVNRNAEVLVMTTEILRNMLHQGAELLRELGCVVFDEVHYMRNAERGLVWEDCLSLLDSRVSFVFLSATIPNAPEFAAWISSIHQKVIHVVYTEYRPVPLQFFVAPVGSQQAFQLFSSDNYLVNQQNLQKAVQALPFSSQSRFQGASKASKKLQTETIVQILQILISKQLSPVIIFSFGKQKCEDLAMLIKKQPQFSNLLTQQQRQRIELLYDAALADLAEEDREIKQIRYARELLLKGVGVHHSGLLPFVKEITEILFQEDLIKIIFVTETFAMGLNLPARCVIFSELKKFDGQDSRYVQSGEFIQMAGRSGRRGKDDQGIVITLFNDQEELDNVIQIMQGAAEPLNSAYRLGYGSIINYLRTEGISPQYVINKSFLQFQHNYRLPRCQKRLEYNAYQIQLMFNKLENLFVLNNSVENQSQTYLHYNQQKQQLYAYYNKNINKFHEQYEQYQQLLLMQRLEQQHSNVLLSMQCQQDIEFARQLQSNQLKIGRFIQVSLNNQQYIAIIVRNDIQLAGVNYIDILLPVYDPSDNYQAKIKNDAPSANFSYQQYTNINSLINEYQQMEATGDLTRIIMADPKFSSLSSLLQNNVKNDVKTQTKDNIDQLIFEQNAAVPVAVATTSKEQTHNQPQFVNLQLYVLINEMCQQSKYLNTSQSINNILKHNISQLPATFEYLKNPEAIQPLIVRIDYSCISQVFGQYCKQIPTSLVKYQERQVLLQNTINIVKYLTEEQLNSITSNSTAKGIQLLDKVANASIFKPLQLSSIPGIAAEIIAISQRLDALQQLVTANQGFQTIKSFTNNLIVRLFYTSDEVFTLINSIAQLNKQNNQLNNHLSKNHLVLQQELKNMISVLKKMEYVSENDVILEKGRLACQINSVNELIITECIFNNIFDGITPEIFAGLICAILGENQQQLDYIIQDDNLQQQCDRMKQQIQHIIQVTSECNTSLDQFVFKEEDIMSPMNAEVAFLWASGNDLNAVCDLSKLLFEGNVVRLLRRLVTSLQQIEEAVQTWNDHNIASLCQRAIILVNRGIVKADSLYIVAEEQDTN